MAKKNIAWFDLQMLISFDIIKLDSGDFERDVDGFGYRLLLISILEDTMCHKGSPFLLIVYE